MLLAAQVSPIPAAPMAALLLVSLGALALRSWQGWQNHRRRRALSAGKTHLIRGRDLQLRTHREPDQVFFGLGFRWNPTHTQRLHELRKLDLVTSRPSAARKRASVGAGWIHGLNTHETALLCPRAALRGNTLIVGAPGSGKTTLFQTLAAQAIYRGDVVIVLDPKGAPDFQGRLRKEAERAGRPFVYFHPAHPGRSVRFDPLKNWNRATEIANRVSALIPAREGGDAFKQFAWTTINRLSHAQLYLGERPNLKTLKLHLQDGGRILLERVLERWLTQPSRESGDTVARTPAHRSRLEALIAAYRGRAVTQPGDDIIDGLAATVEHDRTHYAKMIVPAVPILEMLTSGDIGAMLSPDPLDASDHRSMYDWDKVISSAAVVYMGLDSLADGTVGAAVGSIMLADLTAVAGSRYNFGGSERCVALFVDEASEVVNPSFIQLLNKGREANFVTCFATQTLADFEARMGDRAAARMMIGNANNFIALRTLDCETQSYVAEKFGRTTVQSVSVAQNVHASTKDALAQFSGGSTHSLRETEVDTIPPDTLGSLPDLEFFALICGGALLKGRLTRIVD
jgi:conjugal transfer pilus assembly protein TraD